MTQCAYSSFHNQICCIPRNFFFADWVCSSVLNQIEELQGNLTFLHEVYGITPATKIVNDFTRLKANALKVLTYVNNLSQRPVAHDWNFLKQAVTSTFLVQVVETLCSLERIASDEHDLRVSLTFDAVIAEFAVARSRPANIGPHKLIAEKDAKHPLATHHADITLEHNQLNIVLLAIAQDNFVCLKSCNMAFFYKFAH